MRLSGGHLTVANGGTVTTWPKEFKNESEEEVRGFPRTHFEREVALHAVLLDPPEWRIGEDDIDSVPISDVPQRACQGVSVNDSGRISVLTTECYNLMVVCMQAAFDPDLVFAALADATRRDIVLRAVSGREGVAELAGHYPMSFAAVQKHVAILERAGLVSKHRLGRRKLVQTDIEALRLARGLLDQYEALWRGRIDRMTDLIAAGKETRG